MDRATDIDKTEHGGWTRAAVIVVRVALLVFLVWALFSANFPAQTPVAEDTTSSKRDSRTAVAPSSDTPAELG